MGDSETTREDGAGVSQEGTSGSASQTDREEPEQKSESAVPDTLDEPSAEELLLEDDEWSEQEEASSDAGSVEVRPDAAETEDKDVVDMDKTAEISPEEIDSDLDLEAIREAAKRESERDAGEGRSEETAPADSGRQAAALADTKPPKEGADSSAPSKSARDGESFEAPSVDREPEGAGGEGAAPDGGAAETAELDEPSTDETDSGGVPERDEPGSGEASAGTSKHAETAMSESSQPELAVGPSHTEEDDDEPLTLREIVSDVQDVPEEESLGNPPSLPEMPEDVRGSRETPEEKLNFRSGEKVGGRFTVERYLGSSGGGISYLCRADSSGEPVVIKVLAISSPSEERLDWIREQIRTASAIEHENLTDILGMGTTESGEVFVAMEYVEGDSLSRALAKQREKGREIQLSEVFHVLAHICEGMKAVHEEMTHGLLTPYNIYLAEGGQLKIQNLGFGQIAARAQHREGKGPYRDSIYVPPEVTENPNNLAPRADMYSLGMITGELLSGGGLPRQKGQAREVAIRIAQQFGEDIHRLVASSLEEMPASRVGSPAEFRMALENAIRDAGVDPEEGLPEGGLAVRPAVDVRSSSDDDLFDIPAPDASHEEVSRETEDRYLVRKDGLDYGPFTKEEVLEQLYDDEIDENTSVLDRATQERAPLGEQEEFVQEVEEYIPIREERKRKERERREEIERKVKQGGKAVLVLGIIAGAVVLAGMSYYYFTRPDPQEMPVGKAFVSLDYKFLPPPKEFQTVSADEEILEKIFNPQAAEEEIAKQVEQARGSAPSGGGGGDGAEGPGGGQDEEVSTVDMSESGGSDMVLTDRKINNIILSEFSALRRCIHKELDQNPSFNGVTVKFYIRPNGTTGGVTLREKQYLQKPVGRCLVQEFREMKFPAHSAVSNKGVTFPLRTKR